MRRRRREVASLAAAALGVLSLLAGCTGPPGGQSDQSDRAARSDRPEVAAEARLWVTTPDRSRTVEWTPVGTSEGTEPQVRVGEDGGHRFYGVAASLTGSSAEVLARLSQQRRREVLELLVGQDGIGLAVLRQPVGASDFSDTGDDAEVAALLAEAASYRPSLAVVLSSWSAPAELKTTGSLVGGTLLDEQVEAYADHLAEAVEAYRDAGVPVTGLTVQNEPSFSPSGYPGMTLDVDQQREVLAAVADRVDDVHLWALDDNYDQWPQADELLSDEDTRSQVYGVAFHCYRGDVSALREVRSRHDDVAVAVSECSNGGWSDDFGADLRYEAGKLLIPAVRDGAAWVSKWNAVLDPGGGPRRGGCQDCRGLVSVDPETGQVTPSPAAYVWAHVGRFVTPGAEVLPTDDPDGVESVAFRNPDGSHVALLHNAGRDDTRLAVRDHTVALPAGAVATLTWG